MKAAFALLVGVLFLLLQLGEAFHVDTPHGEDEQCPSRCQQGRSRLSQPTVGQRSKYYYFSQTTKTCRQATGRASWAPASHDENRFQSRKECEQVCRQCLPNTLTANHRMLPTQRLGLPTNDTYGCDNGYCWTRCTVAGLYSEWCWSTNLSYSQSYQYVKCNSIVDCGYSDWVCAGPCTV